MDAYTASLAQHFTDAFAAYYARNYVQTAGRLQQLGREDLLRPVVHKLLARMRKEQASLLDATTAMAKEMETDAARRLVQAAAVVVAIGGYRPGDKPRTLPTLAEVKERLQAE